MSRPEEPTGIGAVVQTIDGRICVRALHKNYPWICETHSGGWREYSQIPDVVRVLSLGVHQSAIEFVASQDEMGM